MDLTKGMGPLIIKWNPKVEKAFQTLKQALCAQPVLSAPDFTKESVVQTDAFDVGLEVVLSQIQDGEEHRMIYLSRKLNAHYKNYTKVQKDCLAIKWALDALTYYLLGRLFKLVTDHAPLQWKSDNGEKQLSDEVVSSSKGI